MLLRRFLNDEQRARLAQSASMSSASASSAAAAAASAKVQGQAALARAISATVGSLMAAQLQASITSSTSLTTTTTTATTSSSTLTTTTTTTATTVQDSISLSAGIKKIVDSTTSLEALSTSTVSVAAPSMTTPSTISSQSITEVALGMSSDVGIASSTLNISEGAVPSVVANQNSTPSMSPTPIVGNGNTWLLPLEITGVVILIIGLIGWLLFRSRLALLFFKSPEMPKPPAYITQEELFSTFTGKESNLYGKMDNTLSYVPYVPPPPAIAQHTSIITGGGDSLYYQESSFYNASKYAGSSHDIHGSNLMNFPSHQSSINVMDVLNELESSLFSNAYPPDSSDTNVADFTTGLENTPDSEVSRQSLYSLTSLSSNIDVAAVNNNNSLSQLDEPRNEPISIYSISSSLSSGHSNHPQSVYSLQSRSSFFQTLFESKK
jgi:hypothetical protein